ncbi:MAG: hypothetical protein HZB47_06510 [Nitrosomonadales bacterium]|nr:hypothetical protein [Nitrosomonadales bacterium]
MKKFALAGVTLALAMAAGSASAGTPAANTFGLNVAVGTATTPMDFMVGGKYFFAKDMAVLAGVGLQFADSGAATNNKSTNIGMMGGFRKYLKTDDLAPFVGGQIQYVSTKPNGGDQTDFAIFAEGGAEYFLTKQFSFEGSVYVGYVSSEIKPAGAASSTKATAFGTARGNLSVNFYF